MTIEELIEALMEHPLEMQAVVFHLGDDGNWGLDQPILVSGSNCLVLAATSDVPKWVNRWLARNQEA